MRILNTRRHLTLKTKIYNFALPTTELMRLPDITRELGISKSTWYQGMKDGRFPKQIKLGGGKSSAWRTSEIRALIDAE